MHSRLYVGQVKHRRYTPAPHAFNYGLFMLYLDLDELPIIFKNNWLWSTRRPALARFKRQDHLGNKNNSLSDEVRDFVKHETGVRLTGPIRLLTNLRYFGYGFNPVSFYYCFNETGDMLETIVAEVNNTPWGEQYCYILPDAHNKGSDDKKRFLVDKRFHVSPFMDMNIDYDWRFNTPDEKLVVHMINYQHDEKLFDATLTLKQQPVTNKNLAKALIQFPLLTINIIVSIHYQALKLWLKGVPFHSYPEKQEAPDTVKRP